MVAAASGTVRWNEAGSGKVHARHWRSTGRRAMQRERPETNRSTWRSWLAAQAADPMVSAVWALGITEIIAWGTTFYALGVLGRPISANTGWSQSLVFGGMTLGLVFSAVLSTSIGRLIDVRGARAVMVAGLALAALGLCLVAAAVQPWQYLAGWAVLGPAMRMILYDAAFAAMVAVAPSRGRRAISYLTLFGGLASTAFWPIGHWLDGAVGWRGTLVAFALLNLLVAAPLAWRGLSRTEPDQLRTPGASGAAGSAMTADPQRRLEGTDRLVAVGLFGLVLAANSFVFGAMSAHIVSVLETSGIGLGAAVALASLKGVAQVAGRVWELVFAQGLSALALGRVAIGLLPVAFAVLIYAGAGFEPALVFTLVFGVSNGLVTIVRGAVPLALFGRDGYGTMLGILATPQLMMNALSPFAFAAVVETFGMGAGLRLLLAAALLSIVAMEITGWWVHSRRGRG